MTETINYRQIRAYANSDLSELFNLRMGKPLRPIDPKAARFGTTFHQMVLEPHKPVDWSIHHVTERVKLQDMTEAFNEFWQEHYSRWDLTLNAEVIQQWTCPQTGLPLKAKLDSVIIGDFTRYVVDLKTTSCRSSAEFFDCFIGYGYDRQAAFYLDAIDGYDEFLFVGVQKCKPYSIYSVDMSASIARALMLERAREKNNRLLRDAHAESLKPDGWRPSSWSRTEIE